MNRRRRLYHAGGLELDAFAAEVLEHPGAASEEHGHEVEPDLIHQSRLDELPADVGPPITATFLSPAADFACSSALSMPSVTKVYTLPSGTSSGVSWVRTNTRVGGCGPSAPHHGSESS